MDFETPVDPIFSMQKNGFMLQSLSSEQQEAIGDPNFQSQSLEENAPPKLLTKTNIMIATGIIIVLIVIAKSK